MVDAAKPMTVARVADTKPTVPIGASSSCQRLTRTT